MTGSDLAGEQGVLMCLFRHLLMHLTILLFMFLFMFLFLFLSQHVHVLVHILVGASVVATGRACMKKNIKACGGAITLQEKLDRNKV